MGQPPRVSHSSSKLRAGGGVNSAVNPSSAVQVFVSSVYYGINFQLGYVAELEGDAVHWGLGLPRFWPG